MKVILKLLKLSNAMLASPVDEKQLRELHIRLRNEPKKDHDIAGQ